MSLAPLKKGAGLTKPRLKSSVFRRGRSGVRIPFGVLKRQGHPKDGPVFLYVNRDSNNLNGTAGGSSVAAAGRRKTIVFRIPFGMLKRQGHPKDGPVFFIHRASIRPFAWAG